MALTFSINQVEATYCNDMKIVLYLEPASKKNCSFVSEMQTFADNSKQNVLLKVEENTTFAYLQILGGMNSSDKSLHFDTIINVSCCTQLTGDILTILDHTVQRNCNVIFFVSEFCIVHFSLWVIFFSILLVAVLLSFITGYVIYYLKPILSSKQACCACRCVNCRNVTTPFYRRVPQPTRVDPSETHRRNNGYEIPRSKAIAKHKKKNSSKSDNIQLTVQL